MTTKFNKDMYVRMRSKKDEPLSALGTKSVLITDRGISILAALPSSPTSAPARVASLTPSVEELPPHNKRLKVGRSRRRRLTPSLLVSGMTPKSQWRELKIPSTQTSLRCFRECQQMTLRGVIFISSYR